MGELKRKLARDYAKLEASFHSKKEDQRAEGAATDAPSSASKTEGEATPEDSSTWTLRDWAQKLPLSSVLAKALTPPPEVTDVFAYVQELEREVSVAVAQLSHSQRCLGTNGHPS